MYTTSCRSAGQSQHAVGHISDAWHLMSAVVVRSVCDYEFAQYLSLIARFSVYGRRGLGVPPFGGTLLLSSTFSTSTSSVHCVCASVGAHMFAWLDANAFSASIYTYMCDVVIEETGCVEFINIGTARRWGCSVQGVCLFSVRVAMVICGKYVQIANGG